MSSFSQVKVLNEVKFEALGACGWQFAHWQLSGMKGVAPLSISESWWSCWTKGREGRGQQSPSVTIRHTRRAAVWFSDGLDWVNVCQSTSPPTPVDYSPLSLPHYCHVNKTVSGSIIDCFNQALCFNEELSECKSVSSSRSLRLSDWFVVRSCQLTLHHIFLLCCSQGRRNRVNNTETPVYSTALNRGLTFPKDSPERKEHA